MANSSKELEGDVVLMVEGKRVIKHNGKLGQIFSPFKQTLVKHWHKKLAVKSLESQFPELSKQIQS